MRTTFINSSRAQTYYEESGPGLQLSWMDINRGPVRIRGVDGTVVSLPERMVVRWEGLRAGKDTPCRGPPLEGKRSVISYHFTKLIFEIMDKVMWAKIHSMG